MNTREITVDGNVLTFENNSFRHDGEIYNMRDGSLIEVRTNFEDED